MSNRNEIICQLYKEGKTQLEIAESFKITKARVHQILSEAGLSKSDRPKISPFKRASFLGVHISEVTKIILKNEADKEGKSMSQLASEFIEAGLTNQGAIIPQPLPVEIDVPLPLEG